MPLFLSRAAEILRAFSVAREHLIIIGGLVPPLLVEKPDEGVEAHIGTLDLDMCMSIALLKGDVGLYENLQKSLESANFEVLKVDSKPVSWRWKHKSSSLVVEFLCPVPSDGSKSAGELHRPGGAIAGKLSALVMRSGELISEDRRTIRRRVTLKSGTTDFDFVVAGPLSWLASKAFALEGREKEKDAYDIVWLCEGWPRGQASLAKELLASPFWSHPTAVEGFRRLDDAFMDLSRLGPSQYATFMAPAPFEPNARRALGAVRTLFTHLKQG